MYHKPEAERETGDLILQSSPDATTPVSSLSGGLRLVTTVWLSVWPTVTRAADVGYDNELTINSTVKGRIM